MENEMMAFRVVRQGDKVIIGVFVHSQQQWIECAATVGQAATIGDIFADACREPAL